MCLPPCLPSGPSRTPAARRAHAELMLRMFQRRDHLALFIFRDHFLQSVEAIPEIVNRYIQCVVVHDHLSLSPVVQFVCPASQSIEDASSPFVGAHGVAAWFDVDCAEGGSRPPKGSGNDAPENFWTPGARTPSSRARRGSTRPLRYSARACSKAQIARSLAW